MIRLCVIGSSHAACWKMASTMVDVGGVQFTWFVASGKLIRELVPQGERLFARTKRLREIIHRTSGGQTSVDPAAYDCFLVIDDFGRRWFYELFRDYDTTRNAHLRKNISLLTEECMRDCIDGILVGSAAINRHGALRVVSEKPIFLAPAPWVSETALDGRHAALRALVGTGRLEEIGDLLQRRRADVAQTHGFALLLQRPETIVSGIYTRKEYSIDGEGLTNVVNDGAHMNARFGSISLSDALTAIRSRVA